MYVLLFFPSSTPLVNPHSFFISQIQLQQQPFTAQPFQSCPTLLSSPSFHSIPEDPNYKWPLLIFSHGVGRGRLTYHTFCGEIARRRYGVCAIQHRDGTCPCSITS